MTKQNRSHLTLKKNKSPIEYLSRFSDLINTFGFFPTLRITSQYLSNPAVNPIVRRSLFRRWIRNNEPNKKELEKQRIRAKCLPEQPLISLLVPVYNPPIYILEQTLDSVAAQTYTNWECCIANGDSSNQAIKDLLDAREKADQRFKVIHLEQNRGIALNTNAAAAIASGSFVGFLDHDDVLAPFALFEVAVRIWNDTAIDLFYSDEDVLNEKGNRTEPFFKPGYSPDLLRSMNYMCHFLMIRKTLGESLYWLREGFDGAQDFDFILRATEVAKKVERIPSILYHWRSVKGSTAADYYAKPYATTSGIRALQDHLQRVKTPGEVNTNYMPTWYRVNYTLAEAPLVSIIIPNHDHAEDLRRLITSILEKSTYTNFEILIIENNSSLPETFELYELLKMEDSRISILEWNHPFNYSAVNNFGVDNARGEVLLFLNNDMEVISPDWLEQMLMHANRGAVGAVGAKLIYPNDTIQHAGIIVGIAGTAGHSHKGYYKDRVGYGGLLKQVHNVSANTAACLMVRREIFLEAGGFDPNYVLAFGDVDLCLKIMHKGYLNVWTPFAELYHYESKTRGYETSPEQRARFTNEISYFKHRWKEFLNAGDSFYNPNLTLKDEGYSIDPAAKNQSSLE